jgi:SAM-dependent methyltransferase
VPHKPRHLTPEHAARFQDQRVVDRYHLRLPYPDETFAILLSLLDTIAAGGDPPPHAVLDVGTGTGEIARRLAARTDHIAQVDALDLSPAMLARGKTLPGGDAPTLRWIQGAAEAAPLNPPYALITGADTVHWMEWEVVFPRFRNALTPHGLVALITRGELPQPWHDDLMALFRHFTAAFGHEDFDLISELEKRALFAKAGERDTAPVTSHQSVEDYIASFHSRASLALAAMPPADAAAFDDALRALVTPYADQGRLALQTVATISWGHPT